MQKTILVVEDNELNRRLFNDVLEAHGYRILHAREAAPVLAIAREHRPDLILMDVQLPGMSGTEVTELLKQDDELRHIPVIALTALAMKGDEDRIRACGCDDYLSKPISIAGFLDTIQRHLA